MNRYFSKLAKRTGIATNSTERLRRQTARVNIRPEFQQNKTASIKRGVEAIGEKIAESRVPQRNSVTESSIGKNSKFGLQSPEEKDILTTVSNASLEESDMVVKQPDPSQSIKADSVEKDIGDGYPTVRPNISDMNSHAHVSQPHETSSETKAVKNDDPDKVLVTEKRQYISFPNNLSPGQNHFDKSEMTNNLSLAGSERQHIRKEKTIVVKTISLNNESQKARETDNDSLFDPRPYTMTKETPSISPETIESSEKKGAYSGTRTIHIVSERGRAAETKLEKAKSPTHDNSVDIHIGTISFEVHQAPEKKTVTNPPPLVPRPVVIQQPHFPKMPRLSRYYLRGM